MTASENKSQLAAALSKAQGMMNAAIKDSTNPHFKSKYADLASIIDAVREPFAKHELSFAQYVQISGETGVPHALVTKLMHSSGESILGEIPLILTKNDMQGLGSAITYARRYGLAAIAGVAQDDDDGNLATQRGKVYPSQPEPGDGHPDPYAEYTIPGGKFVKRKLSEIDPQGLRSYIDFIESKMKQDPTKPAPFWWNDFIERAEGYLGDLENNNTKDATDPQ